MTQDMIKIFGSKVDSYLKFWHKAGYLNYVMIGLIILAIYLIMKRQ